MNLFFDTNVLVALTNADHPHHTRAFHRYERAGDDSLYCGAHSLAEFYAISTRLPGELQLVPAQCILAIDRLADQFHAVTLTASEYLATIRHVADLGMPGGIVYDAILMACARKCKADVIYTFNERHFTRVAPDLADRIRTP